MFNLKTHYALKLLVFLTIEQNDQYYTIDELSEKTGIPRSFLGKIVQSLAKKQYLTTQKGPKGGVKLQRAPTEISISDVLEDLGELHGGLDPKKACHLIESFDHCVMEVFVEDFIADVLDEKTLRDLGNELVGDPT